MGPGLAVPWPSASWMAGPSWARMKTWLSDILISKKKNTQKVGCFSGWERVGMFGKSLWKWVKAGRNILRCINDKTWTGYKISLVRACGLSRVSLGAEEPARLLCVSHRVWSGDEFWRWWKLEKENEQGLTKPLSILLFQFWVFLAEENKVTCNTTQRQMFP